MANAPPPITNRRIFLNMNKFVTSAILSALIAIPFSAQAEDINAIFKKVNDLVAAKNYPKALEELGWATKELEKLNSQQLQSFLPDEVAGFTGKKAEINSALGMTNIERKYTKEKMRLKIAITGGSSGGANQGLGGLAAFGRMAAMMGGGQGQNTFRINGRTASMEDRDDGGLLTVFLESGAMLTLELNNASDSATLKTVAEGLDLNKMDNYMRGQG
jgi:hypothetical protein